MASLEEQLRAVKLKKSLEPQKDFSSPKTAGYISQEEIQSYQMSVLDVNTEEWFELLEDYTFPSRCVPIDIEDAKLFVSIFDRLYAKHDPSVIATIDWREHLSSVESKRIKYLCSCLQEEMDSFLVDKGAEFAFVKLSSRSPKDAPMAQSRFKQMYQNLISQEHLMNLTQVEIENLQVTSLLKAAFQALKMKFADDVIDCCVRSERVYQDLLLALALPSRFRENWIVRQFVDIDVDMEFRGFVHQQRLTALSQYNYLIYSERLANNKDFYTRTISTFFERNIKPKLSNFVKDYIIDFAVCEDGEILSFTLFFSNRDYACENRL